MGWTAPRTWVAEEVVTAALMNTHVRDNFSFLGGTHKHGTVTGDGAGSLGPLELIRFQDSGTDFTGTGVLWVNGTILKYSRNATAQIVLSEAAGVGTPSIREIGAGGTQGAAGDHGHTLNNVANVLNPTGTGASAEWGTMIGTFVLDAGTVNLIATARTPTNTNGLLHMTCVILVRAPNPAATATGTLWIHRTIAGTGTVETGTITHTLTDGSTTAFFMSDVVNFPTLLSYNWTIRATADGAWSRVTANGMNIADFTF